MHLTPGSVARLHHEGGTILGSSRGAQDAVEVVDTLQALGVAVLFVVGGDGTLRGALQTTREIERRGARIAVVGAPKTIDNDIHLRDRIVHHFKSEKREVTLEYIDPSYAIRSIPASPSDSVYCWNMAWNAVHTATAGNTECQSDAGTGASCTCR